MNSVKSKGLVNRITKYFVNQRHLAWLLSIALVILGVISFNGMPKESLPEIVFPSLIVQTSYLGASAVDVEKLVTIPIENKIRNIGAVDNIQSSSVGNFSVVSIIFEEGVDIDKMQTNVANRLAQINFPDGVSQPEISNFTTSEIPLLSFSLSSEESLDQLTQKAMSIKEDLLQMQGVSDVVLKGGVAQEIQIIVDEEEMLKYGVGYYQIQEAINGANVSFPIGSVSIGSREYRVSVDESIKSLEDIETLIIRTPYGSEVKIRDFAEVRIEESDIEELNRTYSDKRGVLNSILVQVIRENQSDVLGTSKSVKELVEEKADNYSLTYNVLTDLSKNVNEDLSNIQASALSGFAVVIIILFLFIGFKESLIAAFSIPLSLMSTIIVLQLLGVTLNTFVILGLIVSLGLLVDNSIIVIENIERWRKSKKNMKEASIIGTSEVGLPIIASTSTTVAAFFPLAILPGIIGSFINTIPRTIIITLIASLVMSLTIVPTLYSYIKRKSDGNMKIEFVSKIVSVLLVLSMSILAFYSEDVSLVISIPIIILLTMAMIVKQFKPKDKFDVNITVKYDYFLKWILSKRHRFITTILVGILIMVLSFTSFGMGWLKVSFFPSETPNTLEVTVNVPMSTSIDETLEVIESIEYIIAEEDIVDSFTTTVGGNKENQGILILKLDTDNENHSDSIQIVNDLMKEIPGITFSVEGGANQGPPVGKPIVIRLENNDMNELLEAVEIVSNQLKDQEGVINLQTSLSQESSDLLIEVDFEKASKYGISAWYLIQYLNTKVSGTQLSTAIIDEEELDIIMKYGKENFSSLQELSSLPLVIPSGEIIPMSLVANPVERNRVSQIDRQDGKRFVTISADLLSGYNATDITNDLRNRVQQLNIEDTNVIYLGEVSGINDSFTNLLVSMIIAIFLVFAILTIQMKSIIQPFVILMTIPMALVGVIVGLIITGNDFGFYAFMGVVSLVGIAVNDAIVLIDFMNKSRVAGMTIKNAITNAVSIRFNPVIATTLTTIGGVLPLAFRNVYYEQFSYALIFGLLLTTVLTLLFIPILYYVIESVRQRFSRKTEEV